MDYIMVDGPNAYHSAGPTNMLDLSSDHRAVQVCVKLPHRSDVQRFRKKRQTHKDVDWSTHSHLIPNKIADCRADTVSLQHIDQLAKDVVEGGLGFQAFGKPALMQFLSTEAQKTPEIND